MSSSEQYAFLAPYYDALNSQIDYSEWAKFLKSTLSDYGVPDGAIVLDLACGTGSITIELAKYGYDMIGADISSEMLWAARNKVPAELQAGKILWIEQDMRSFELYGTVGAVVCCLDSINYITDEKELGHCFSLVQNYLDPGGMFIFDVNTPYKFENIYADKSYILQADGVYCGWENNYDKESGLCEFSLDIFVKNDNGMYKRFEETQIEKCYTDQTLRSILKENGFTVEKVVSGFDMSDYTEKDERWYYICRSGP